MAGQRESILDLAPPWLLDANGQAFLGTLGTALDVLLTKGDQASRAALPGYGDDNFIPFQAADRLLVQGPGESNANFIVRLQGALDAWRRAGSRLSILNQLHAYLSNAQPTLAATLPECLIVGGNSALTTWHWHDLGDAQGSAPNYRLASPNNWNWDGLYTPNRAWLILYMATVPTGQSGTGASVASTGGSGVAGVTSGFATLTGLSGLDPSNVQQWITLTNAGNAANNGVHPIDKVVSATSCVIANPLAAAGDTVDWEIGRYQYLQPAPVWGSNSFVWGQGNWGVTSPDSIGGAAYARQIIETARLILKRWKSAGTYYPNIIICFQGGDGTSGYRYSPLNAADGRNPDGTFGEPGYPYAGAWLIGRQYLNDHSAYCDGTGDSPQCYEKWRS